MLQGCCRGAVGARAVVRVRCPALELRLFTVLAHGKPLTRHCHVMIAIARYGYEHTNERTNEPTNRRTFPSALQRASPH